MEKKFHSEKFTVDNITYELVISGITANINIIGGVLSNGERIKFYEDSFEENCSKFGVNNLTKNPIKVLRKFTNVLTEYIYRERPSVLMFTALEKNRYNLYKRITQKNTPNGYTSHFNDLAQNILFFKNQTET